MKTSKLAAFVAAASLAVGGFVAAASPASATNCEWLKKHGHELPGHCKPKPKPTKPPKPTTTKAETTTTTVKGESSTTTTAPKTTTTVKPETKPKPVKVSPKYTG